MLKSVNNGSSANICNIAFVLMATALIGCTEHSKPENAYTTPSALNANRKAFDQKKVTVRGLMRVGFESYGLWENRRAYKRGSFAEDCVSLLIPKFMDYKKFDMHEVELTGVFSAEIPKNVFLSGGCYVTVIQLNESAPPTVLGK
jgi:hypothetical protein